MAIGDCTVGASMSYLGLLWVVALFPVLPSVLRVVLYVCALGIGLCLCRWLLAICPARCRLAGCELGLHCPFPAF